MGKTLYLECYSGISGDMTVAALLDLGADREKLDRALKSLPITGFRTVVSRVIKSGLDACDFSVILDEDNHDHDMEYLHGTGQHHSHEEHEHHHEEHGAHHDGREHCHEAAQNHHHEHMHRGIKEIREILNGADLTEKARTTALKIFQVLAEAESKAHGVPVEEVHFHEVGAIDSIVDITAVAVCLDDLGITDVIVPILWEGTGFIRCQHGQIPVPVPAVSNIVSANHLKLKITDVQGELVTPTGAAVVAAVRTSEKLPEDFTIEKNGLGAGKRQYSCPGVLRAMLIHTETAGDTQRDTVWKLETDIDDCTGETMGRVMNLLISNGAREVHYTPVYMKKNRPAYELTVICKEDKRAGLEQIVFEETTTIGIRRTAMDRTILKRESQEIETTLGRAVLKVCELPDGKKRAYPEYDSAAALADANGISFREAYNRILDCWETER